MQGELGKLVIREAKIPADLTSAHSAISTICDMGSCQNAIAILNFTFATSSDVSDITFWTSVSDTCGVAATQQTATTNTVQVQIVSDKDHLISKDSSNNNVSDLSISSYRLSNLGASGVTVVDLPNIRRYLYCQYGMTGDAGIGTADFGIVFIGQDGQEQPAAAARSAY